MAILQFFQSNPVEEQVFRTLKALSRFLEVSNIYSFFLFLLLMLTIKYLRSPLMLQLLSK